MSGGGDADFWPSTVEYRSVSRRSRHVLCVSRVTVARVLGRRSIALSDLRVSSSPYCIW